MQRAINTIAAVALMLLLPNAASAADCKRCAEQQRACKANYAASVCKNEYDICMKGCRK